MLRLSSTTRLALVHAPVPFRTAAFHSSRYSLLPDTENSRHPSTSSPPPNLTPAARRRLQPDPEFSSSSPSPPSLGPNPISPPPEQARLPPKRRVITSVTELPPSFGRNQIIEVPQEVENDLQDVLSAFKKSPVRFAFAYGSGVFRQKGYTAEDKPLLDFVFAVSHPSHWHAINMQQHPQHYSGLMRLLGANAVAWLQEKGLGAEVWFNVEVEVNGKTVKYGCISVDALCRDMLDWETLYISGRTQKPVKILLDDARVRLANQVNLASALRTSLLLLPESFTEVQLFETIAGLSYQGDFRMKVGENPHKVRNIVAAQLPSFRSLYGGLLKSFWKSVHTIGEDGHGVRLMRQDLSSSVRASTASRLPKGLRDKVLGHYERKWNLEGAIALSKAKSVGNKDKAETSQGEDEGRIDLDQQKLWERIVEDDEFNSIVSKSIGQIVARPTFNQSLKGILSAGILRSLRYVLPKLRKKFSASS
ncbi:putative phosphatidate cytidylyltransferase [Sporobolomyces salmoneus]|uniref:putative phosphatidate cytidylyltransferase n=1 Tax=Sporobolomyces salmoneus TaxID=183962 RepID=UPI0031803AC9